MSQGRQASILREAVESRRARESIEHRRRPRWRARAPEAVDLARHEAVSLRAGGGEIRCVAGRVWVTQTGDREDRILGPGGVLAPARGGKIVVQALEEGTRVRLYTSRSLAVRPTGRADTHRVGGSVRAGSPGAGRGKDRSAA